METRLFIGNNELMLCQATVVQALQIWADKVFAPGQSPIIESIVQGSNTFIVKTKCRPEGSVQQESK